MQVLLDNQQQGDPFDIQARSFVRLEGTLTADWNIQSKRRGAPASTWQDEFVPDLQETVKKSPTIQGAVELEYRVNIKTNTAGPTAYVYEAKQEIFK